MNTPDLAGLLARRPAPPADTNDKADVAEGSPPDRELDPHPTAPTASVAPTPVPVRQVTATTETTVEPRQNTGATQWLRSITVYLPRGLHQQVGDAAKAGDTTRTALILDAVNQHHHQLAVPLHESPEPPRGSRSLFTVPQARPATEPSVQTTIRITDEQHAALEQLAATHDVNRSKIIATALRLHLQPAPPSGA